MNSPTIQLHSKDSSSQFLAIGSILFDERYLLVLARSSNFYKRTPRKIDVCNLTSAICVEGPKAPRVTTTTLPISKPKIPSMAHRDKPSTSARGQPSQPSSAESSKTSSPKNSLTPIPPFRRVSGVANAISKACNARIQVIYNLLSGSLIHLSIDPYSKSDLAAAPDLQLQSNELALRDRGCLIPAEIQHHLDAGADCIYRHKTDITYLDPQTKEPIDLLALLRKHGHLDIPVLLNNKSHTPVRLVCAPVSEETANLRRMKFAALHRASKSLMLILLQARLLLITCCTNILYRALKSLSADIEQSDGFHKTLLRYYCYDQRKRQNFSEKWSSLA